MLQNCYKHVIYFYIKYQISQRSWITCKYSKKQNEDEFADLSSRPSKEM